MLTTKTTLKETFKKKDKKFQVIGFDSEGYFNLEKKDHYCDIVRFGNVLFDGEAEPLYFTDLIDTIRETVLKAHAEGVTTIGWCFFGKYDLNQLIRSFDHYTLEKLYNRDSRKVTYQKEQRPQRKEAEDTVTFNQRLKKYEERLEKREFKKDPNLIYPVSFNEYGKFSPRRWKMDYLEGKFIELSFVTEQSARKAAQTKKESDLKWVKFKIQDIGSVFGGSFLNALRDFSIMEELTAEEVRKLTEGKNDRDIRCSAVNRNRNKKEVIEYNGLEIKAGNLLLIKLITMLTELGYDMDWKNDLSGIGEIAHKVMEKAAKEGAHLLEGSEVLKTVGETFYIAANRSYYGGLIEVLKPGLHKNVVKIDKNSAYPSVMARKIPCLKDLIVLDCRTKEQAISHDKRGNNVLLKIRFREGDRRMGPLPFRMPHGEKISFGTVIRPQSGIGYYWLHEILASEKAMLIERENWEVLDGWVMISQCDCKPFAYIDKFYEERLKAGKNSSKGNLLKTLSNSQYGKAMQSQGNPKYSNAIWGALITSYVRTELLLMISQLQRKIYDVIAIATDAIFTTQSRVPHTLQNSDKLGEWSVKKYSEMFFLRTGIWGGKDYTVNGDKEDWDFKTRGISYNAFVTEVHSLILPKLKEFTENKVWDSDFTVKTFDTFSMLSLGEALQRGDLSLTGTFVLGQEGLPENAREISFNLEPKRYNVRWDSREKCFITDTPLMSWDRSNFFGLSPESSYYDKVIGNVKLSKSVETESKTVPETDSIVEETSDIFQLLAAV